MRLKKPVKRERHSRTISQNERSEDCHLVPQSQECWAESHHLSTVGGDDILLNVFGTPTVRRGLRSESRGAVLVNLTARISNERCSPCVCSHLKIMDIITVSSYVNSADMVSSESPSESISSNPPCSFNLT